MAEFKAANHIADGEEWERFSGLEQDAEVLQRFLEAVPFAAKGVRRLSSPVLRCRRSSHPGRPSRSLPRMVSAGSCRKLAVRRPDLGARIVTTSPDVTVSTNLGPWVNKRGLFARRAAGRHLQGPWPDEPRSAGKWAPRDSISNWALRRTTCFCCSAAAGLSHSLFGERLIPIGTLYDPFIQRGLDALNYACYQDARFILVATPSGVTLAPEGGAHQSISTPLIGMAQDGLAAFEPTFVDELAVIMGWSFDYVQREGEHTGDSVSRPGWLRDEKGGSVYLRLSTRPVEQPVREMTPNLHDAIIQGGYWLREPEPGSDLIVAYTGAVAPEAIEAAGLLAENRRGLGVLAITSADRLSAGWHAACRARERGEQGGASHIEQLLAGLSRDAGIITLVDGHPETLSWLGAVRGHEVRALGVEHFGQSGSIPELYSHHGLDADAILAAAKSVGRGR